MANTYEYITLIDAANGMASVTVNIALDGTNDTGGMLVDKSALVGPDGTEPTSLKLLRIIGISQGLTRAKVRFDSTSDRTIGYFVPGAQYLTWSRFSGCPPTDTGGNGDLLVDLTGTISGGSVSFQIELQMVN